jgi:hypothetical protein
MSTTNEERREEIKVYRSVARVRGVQAVIIGGYLQ